MELSVYISNERIEIVAGTGSKSKAKIKKVYSLAVPEGTIMNGIKTSCFLANSYISCQFFVKSINMCQSI